MSANPSPELIALAFQIADSCSRSDIECHCVEHSGDAQSGWWFDTSKIESEDKQFIEDAARYLEMRSLLRRMPDQAHIVGFINVRAAS